MTAIKMKQSSVNLINQIDDQNTELLEKVYLFPTTNVPPRQAKTTELTEGQKRRLALVKKYAGAFSACQTADWESEKEEYLLEKYGR